MLWLKAKESQRLNLDEKSVEEETAQKKPFSNLFIRVSLFVALDGGEKLKKRNVVMDDVRYRDKLHLEATPYLP